MEKNDISIDTTPENMFTEVTQPVKEHVHTPHKKQLSTPIAIIIAAIILGFSHIGYAVILSQKNDSQKIAFAGSAISEKDFPTGDIESDVIVVEYSDTECPFCARLHPVMQQIQQKYNDKVTFVYRHFPLTQIHPGAFGEAQAIECVGKELGATKRRMYIDALFGYKINNGTMVLPKGMKETLAISLGAQKTTLERCLSDEWSSQAVLASIKDGVNAGVSGTPATFVLKKDGDTYEVIALIEGAREYEYVEAAVQAALQ